LFIRKQYVMQVKGTGIKTTRDFVKTKFPTKYDGWLNTLPNQSKQLYTYALNVGDWYDIQIAYYHPVNKITELFYNNNSQIAGDELGRFSAESSLKGIYKVFLLVASPHYLMKRAANMMQAFYNPSEIEVAEASQKHVIFKIKKFDGINKTTEYRIAGWCARALELCNCQKVSYRFISHISSGQTETVIEFKWE